MAHILLIASGLVHGPLDELQGETPLAVAKVPHLTTLASRGVVGRVRVIPEGMEPLVEVGCLSLLGYDPAKYYTGRGPLEAVGFGVALQPGEVAFRCHLITEHEGRIVDETAGGITTPEATVLLEALNTRLGTEGVQFHAGEGHRHIMVVRDPAAASSCLTLQLPAPRAILNRLGNRVLSRSAGGSWLAGVLQKAREALASHEVNQVRIDLQENPANGIWCWGQGSAPTLPPLRELAQQPAAIVSGSHAVEGIGRLAGAEVLARCGTLGHGEAAYREMARAMLRGLKKFPMVIAYVPLIEETQTGLRARSRISAIETFDRTLVGPLMEAPATQHDTSWLVAPSNGPMGRSPSMLPFVAAGPGMAADPAARFHEQAAAQSALAVQHGHELMAWWLHATKAPREIPVST